MDQQSIFDAHPYAMELREIRAEALRWIAAGQLALAFVIIYVWAFNADLTGPENVIVGSIFAGSALAARRVVVRNFPEAVIILTGGAVGGVVAAAILWSSGEAIYGLLLVLFIAPLLLEWRQALWLGAGVLALIGALAFLQITPLPAAGVTAILSMVVATIGLSWVAYQPMRAMITWSWAGYLEQRQKTSEVRERQAELVGISRSLAEACDRLEQANQSLAEARRAAEQARRLKDEFATAISHELRTPINLIIGFSEMIVGDSETSIPATFRDDVETIYRNACHLSTLVDDVLDLGRLEAQRMALIKSWSSIATIVDEAVQAVKGLYDSAGLAIIIDIPPDLPPLYADPVRIRQVLINLLTNAVRYVEEGYTRISVCRDGGDLIVSVTDTGGGIAAEDLPHIFERFQQTGHLRRRGGFGLGLTVSKQLVELHGGSMWVTSELDRGTTFSFTLPVVGNVAALAINPRLHLLEPHQRTNGPARPTVLIAGQDADAVRVFQRYLDGCQMLAAATPTEIYRISRSSVVSAVVVANAVPEAFDRALHDRFRGLPTFRCSVHTVARASEHLGVAAFLSKPVSAEQLRKTLRRLKLHPRRVLVIDDDPDMTRLLARMLRRLIPGGRVRTAISGQQGLALARTGFAGSPPELIILDLLMPELNGHAFINTWQADPIRRSTPIIVISAAAEEDHDLIIGESLEVRWARGLSVAEMLGIIRGSIDRLLPSEADSLS